MEEIELPLPPDFAYKPHANNAEFLYYMDNDGNIYHPGETIKMNRDASSSTVEIKELVCVWSKDEYAVLKGASLTIYPGTKTNGD